MLILKLALAGSVVTASLGGGLVAASASVSPTPVAAMTAGSTDQIAARALSSKKPGSKCTAKQKGKAINTKQGKLKCSKKGKKFVWKKVATPIKVLPTPPPAVVPTPAVTCATGGGAAGTCVLGSTGPGGGKVFYVNESNPTGSRYMEAAAAGTLPAWDDSNAGLRYPWCVGPAQTSLATGGYNRDLIGSGKRNTAGMVAACDSGAANSVWAYTGGGLAAGSWFLPSRDELNQLYLQRTVVGGFVEASYWTSSEVVVDGARRQLFTDGTMGLGQKSLSNYVRPVRAF